VNIEKNSVVSFHYRLSEVGGEELESTHGDEPSLYLHGYQNIMPGLEQAMLSKAEGDIFSATLAPAQAYGERRENAKQRVSLKHLANKPKGKLKPGDIVGLNTAEGVKQATVVKVGLKNVDVDNNHPLAGKSIQFDIEILSVREASGEELEHGHAHGVGGHQH